MLDFKTLQSYAAAKLVGDQSKIDSFLIENSEQLSLMIAKSAQRELAFFGIPNYKSAYVDPDGTINVGLDLLHELDDKCLEFAATLTRTYETQLSSFGPSVPLSVRIAARDFPAAALEFYAGNRMPKAFEPDGSPRSQFDLLMMALLPKDTLSLSELKSLHIGGLVPLETASWESEPVVTTEYLHKEPFPHILFLYERLLWDTLAVLIAHEASHLILGHFDRTDSPSENRSREDEVQADAKALELLKDIESFNLRSATLLFAYLSLSDSTEQLDKLSHPFASDRLGILAGAVNTVQNENLIADLNSGFKLLRRDVKHLHLNETIKHSGLMINAWCSSDLYYSTTLFLQVKCQGARSAPMFDPLIDPKKVPWDVEIVFALRDRIHPDREHRTGVATLRTDVALQTNIANMTWNESLTLLVFEILLPPSWWLDLDQAVVVIEQVTIKESKSPAPCEQLADITFQGDSLDDTEAYSEFRMLCDRSRQMALIAAHRAILSEPTKFAMELIQEAHDRLDDHDVRILSWLAKQLRDQGELERAEELLEDVMSSADYIPLGTRGQLAEVKFQMFRCLIPRRLPLWRTLNEKLSKLYNMAFDLADRELNLSTEKSEQSAAADLYVRIISEYKPTEAVSEIIAGLRSSKVGYEAEKQQREEAKAKRFFAKALGHYERALKKANSSLVIASQLAGEAAFALAMKSNRDFSLAVAYFEQVLTSDPSFIPALTELAKIWLESKDYVRVRVALDRAERISPNHPFIKYVKDEYQKRLSGLVDPLIEAASEAIDNGDIDTAMSYVEKLANIDPELPQILYLRGLVSYFSGHLANARDAIQAYISREGETFDAMAFLGQILLEIGAFDEAWETLSIVIGCAEHQFRQEDITGETTPFIPYSNLSGRSFVRAARSVILYHHGEYERALVEAKEAVIGFPTGGLCLLDCAEVQRLSGRIDEAQRLTRAALAANELRLPEVLAQRASTFVSGNDVSLLQISGSNAKRDKMQELR